MNSLKSLLRRFGLRKKNHPYPNKGGWPGLRALPQVETLIDIGIGHQGTEGLYAYFPNTAKFFIDPIQETRLAVESHLIDPKNTFIACALSDKAGELELIVREPISQSGFEIRPDEPEDIKRRKVPVKTLDSLFHDVDICGKYGIKIDVEGHEMNVLNGGKQFIASCSWLVVETAISNARFKNFSTFKEVYPFLVSLGFDLVSIRVSKDYLDHCDLAFINTSLSS